MRALTCFIIVIFISLIFYCVESRFAGRGGFRSSRYRSSSRRIGSWPYRYSSFRRASSRSTNAPRRTYYDSNFYSRRASRVTTIKPELNERRNFDTRNRISSRRINFDESTRRSYYPGYNSGNTRTSIYPNSGRYYNEGVMSSSYYPDKADHSGTKNAVLAGLGGSALGAYLGYQLSNMQNQPLMGPVGYNPPQYSVVHHYHHGNDPIIKDAKLDDTVVTQCNNVAFCTPNSQPLCLTNGTIYCISPMKDVKKCNTTSGEVSCLITTLTVPCKNGTDSGCNGANPVKHETVEIPCATNLFISDNLNTGKLQNPQILANNNNLLVGDNTGTLNEFCVTVIAEPIAGGKQK